MQTVAFGEKLVTNLLKPTITNTAAAFALFLFAVMPGPAAAQDTAAQEAAHRREVLATLPPDAARRVFGRETTPAPGPARSIGSYAKGCLAGGVELPPDGPTWQVMRPSRGRAWGHPRMIAFLEQLAAHVPTEADWPGLLVGDIGQPRGGPMLTGHASHQIGLDADIWLTPMPDRRLTTEERDNLAATDMVAPGGLAVDSANWRPAAAKLLEAAARGPGVERIFVNPAIKRELCREAGPDRGWLRLIRPFWGHNYHFHVRLACPPDDSDCHNPIAPPPPGDGCDQLGWWFTPEALHPKPGHPGKPLLMSQMPAECRAVAGE